MWPAVRNQPTRSNVSDQALTVYSLNDLLHYVHAVSGQPQRTPRRFLFKRGRGFKSAANPWLGEGGQEKNPKEVPAADLNFALIRYQTGTPFERF